MCLIAILFLTVSETEELLVNLESTSSTDVSGDAPTLSSVVDRLSQFPNLNLKKQTDVIDVTIPVQCLVEEGGKLTLYEGGSKTDLAGFFDPCAPTTVEMIRQQEEKDPERHLLIRYLFQNFEHQVIVGDSEGVKLPKTSHKVHRLISR